MSRPGRAQAGSSATTPSVQHSTFSLRAPASEHHGASAARASASDPPFPSSASSHHHHSFPSSPSTPASSSHLSHHHQRDPHHPHHPHPQHQSRQHHHYDQHHQRYHNHQHASQQPSPPRHPAASLHASTSPPLAIAQPVAAHSVTSDFHIMSANGNGHHAQGPGHLPPHQTSPPANHHQPYAPAARDHHGSPHSHHHHQQARPRSPLHATTSYYSRGAPADAHRDIPPSGRVYDPLTDMTSSRRPAESWHGAPPPQSTPPKVRYFNIPTTFYFSPCSATSPARYRIITTSAFETIWPSPSALEIGDVIFFIKPSHPRLVFQAMYHPSTHPHCPGVVSRSPTSIHFPLFCQWVEKIASMPPVSLS